MLINKYTKEPDRSTMITNLVHIKKRNRFILKIIGELFDQGKNILCLSGRLRQVNLFYKLLNRDPYLKGNVGKYIGKMSEDELAKSATKQIILGTYDMAQEGLDIENLNAVILCTPKRAIKQSVGRILRKEIYEEHPTVIDICDKDNDTFKKQSMARDSYYKKQNYNIQYFNIADYPLEGYTHWNDGKNIKKYLNQTPVKINKPLMETNQHFGPVNCDDIEFLDD